MRPWLLMFVLLLSILIHEAQGIRLRKGTLPYEQHSSSEYDLEGKRNAKGVEETNPCKSKQCSGRIRKLKSTPTSSTATISKNDKNIEENKAEANSENYSTNEKMATKDEKLQSVNSSSKTSDHQGQLDPETYPDVMDVTRMDYSLQARRKPPIHN